MNSLPFINPKRETKKIIGFLKKVQKKTGFDKVVIGISGGIDSALSLALLTKAYKKKNIFPVYMPFSLPFFRFREKNLKQIKEFIEKLKIPEKNFSVIILEGVAEKIAYQMKTTGYSGLDKIVHDINDCFTCPNIDLEKQIRMGNVLARLRMIFLFDQAKKNRALVCGTENKSEHLLGYYTRFGDGASDIEPIRHLYKTHIFEMAKYLRIPKEIIEKEPSAGLWACQTDEGEFGFTYQEADQVLYLYHDRGVSKSRIKKMGYKNMNKIIGRMKSNLFKALTPYQLTSPKSA